MIGRWFNRKPLTPKPIGRHHLKIGSIFTEKRAGIERVMTLVQVNDSLCSISLIEVDTIGRIANSAGIDNFPISYVEAFLDQGIWNKSRLIAIE